MYLLNYDFYDLQALLIFFRANTDKVQEYTEALKQLINCMEHHISGGESEFNIVRKILKKYTCNAEHELSWVGTENIYTANIIIIKNADHYSILTEVLREMLCCINDTQRLWSLCDAVHNLPMLLLECKKPKKVIKSMIKTYQKDYNSNFLVKELRK